MPLETLQGSLVQMASTILNRLGLPAPSNLSPGLNLTRYNPCRQVVIVHLDNFGLLEVAMHKPQFLLKESSTMLSLETANGYAANVTKELVYGNLAEPFNLFSFIVQQGKTALIVDREEQRSTAGTATFIPADTDMRVYIETAKLLNRTDLLLIHFLDYDKLLQQHSTRPPLELAQKLLHRTDRWLLGFYKQAVQHTLFLVLGNKGQRDYGIKYEDKYEQWAKANLPICLVIYKGPEG